MLTNLTKETNVILSNYVAEEIGFANVIIHSVFPNGFNLITKENQLIFVGKSTQPLSAYGIAIDAKVFDRIQPFLAVDDEVRFGEEKMVIRTDQSVIQLKWLDKEIRSLALPKLHFNVHKQEQLLEQLRQFPLWNDSGFVLNPSLTALFNQWRQGAIDNEDSLASLVGAGVGLTPSGDDFIQGLMMMEKLTKRPTHVNQKIEEILTRRQTTDVSLAYYDVLAKGYVNETWIDLFHGVDLNQPHKMKQAIEEIRHYGSTSGNDLLLGVQMYLENI